MSDELPKGWATAPLSEIADINPRHRKGLDDSLPISFARMTALNESKPEFESLEERTLGEVRKRFTHFAEGDVLFAKITPCMENGKGAVATGLRNGIGCGTTELHVIRPLAEIDPHYVYLFLAQPSIRRAAKENFTGTAGQARVPTSFIEGLELPLAPLAEQRRIVAKLETLLGKVDASRQQLAKIPVLLKRFRQSVLAAACSGRLTADWREERTTDCPDDTDKKPSVKSAKSVVKETALSLISQIGERRKALWKQQRKAKGLVANPADYPEPANPSDEFEFDVPDSWEICSMDSLTSVITSGSRDWKQYYRNDGAGTFTMAQNIRPLRFDRSYRLAVAPPENDRDCTRSEVFKDDLLVTIVGAGSSSGCRTSGCRRRGCRPFAR